MIVERVRAIWKAEAERRRPNGTPSGSRWGSCTAMLQQLMFAEETKPEPIQPRVLNRAVVEAAVRLTPQQWRSLSQRVREGPGPWSLHAVDLQRVADTLDALAAHEWA